MRYKSLLKLLLVSIAVLALSACESISGYLWFNSLKPDQAFDAAETPAAPDYSRNENWAAHPAFKDNSDIEMPPAAASPIDSANSPKKVDVFFVHPTTDYSSNNWNQPLSNQQANTLTDQWVLLNQASIFAHCCRVYAPRYRQAALYAVLSDEPDANRALDLAYGDIKAAFEHFLQHSNQGRPYIIASHSQGSWHALRLLEEVIVDSSLNDRLVAAYMVGMPIPLDKFEPSVEGLTVCEHEHQTQCVVSWNSLTESADSSFFHHYARVRYEYDYKPIAGKELLCVNPLNWSTGSQTAPASLNLGGVNFRRDNSTRPEPDKEVVTAQCNNGILVISEPNVSHYDWFLFGEGNYHMHDYDLFYLNIQRNVQSRVQAYFKQIGDDSAGSLSLRLH